MICLAFQARSCVQPITGENRLSEQNKHNNHICLCRCDGVCVDLIHSRLTSSHSLEAKTGSKLSFDYLHILTATNPGSAD